LVPALRGGVCSTVCVKEVPMFASSVAIPYAANAWYHIELRNLDWTAKRFDYYVNGALIRAAAPFRASSATAVRRLDLFNMTSATVYWDQITFE
jgi:hypothetical protein